MVLPEIQEWVNGKGDKERSTCCVHVGLNRSPLLWLEPFPLVLQNCWPGKYGCVSLFALA